MAEDQDQENKTEQPTQKRLEEAFRKGNIPFSREVTNFFILTVLALTVVWLAPGMMSDARNMLVPFLDSADSLPTDGDGLRLLLTKVAIGSAAIIALPAVAIIAAAFASSFLQNGIVLSNEPIMPQLERISPLAGIKRMFSIRSVMELIKSLFKIAIVGYVAFIAVYPEMQSIRRLPNSSVAAMLIFLATVAKRMTIGVAIAMFFIALFDLLFQRFQYIKSLKMTRQEVRDEYKQSEGDPMVKQRLRRIRQERAKKRMMSMVPKADVVITNPTHFAVALQYNSEKMKAPMVIAKGQDLVALRIREIAETNKVPIVENPPLARALFDTTEVDQEIPVTHYEAVAKVISYVYQLKGRKR